VKVGVAVQLEGHEVDEELIVITGAETLPQSNCKNPLTGVGVVLKCRLLQLANTFPPDGFGGTVTLGNCCVTDVAPYTAPIINAAAMSAYMLRLIFPRFERDKNPFKKTVDQTYIQRYTALVIQHLSLSSLPTHGVRSLPTKLQQSDK
jgi:hypothetical protein